MAKNKNNPLSAFKETSKPGKPFLSSEARVMKALTAAAHKFPQNLAVTSKDIELDRRVRQLEIHVKEKPANITKDSETIQQNLAQFEANRRLQSALEFLKLYGPQFLPLQDENKERMMQRSNLITLAQQLINEKDHTLRQTIEERMRGSKSRQEVLNELQNILDNTKKLEDQNTKLATNEELLGKRLHTLSNETSKHVNNFAPIGNEQRAPGFGKNTGDN